MIPAHIPGLIIFPPPAFTGDDSSQPLSIKDHWLTGKEKRSGVLDSDLILKLLQHDAPTTNSLWRHLKRRFDVSDAYRRTKRLFRKERISKLGRTTHFAMLPMELLEQIFLYCLPTHCSLDLTQAPLLLCRVCPFWNCMALKLPSLWNNLSLLIAHNFASRNDKKLSAIINLWFGYAKGSPLSILLRVGPDRLWPIWYYSTERVVQFSILPCLNHIRELGLIITTESGLLPFLEPSEGRVEQLESLELIVYARIRTEPLTIFESAPRLRKVVINMLPSQIALPWAQLTHLNVVDIIIPFHTWRALLHQCEKLENCTFAIDTTEVPLSSSGSMPFIALPNLATMKLKAFDQTWRLPLNDMVFPALTELGLEFCRIDTVWLSAADPMLTSLHFLRRLVLKWNDASVDDLLALLRAIPSVVELELTHHFEESVQVAQMWDALTLQTQGEIMVLPRLEMLVLYVLEVVVGTFHEWVVAFTRMVESRCNRASLEDTGLPVMPQKLQRLSVVFFWCPDDCQVQALLKLQAHEGLELQIIQLRSEDEDTRISLR